MSVKGDTATEMTNDDLDDEHDTQLAVCAASVARVLSAVSPPQQCITVLMFGGVPRKPVPFAFDPEPLFADARVLQEQHWQEARRSMVVARHRRG